MLNANIPASSDDQTQMKTVLSGEPKELECTNASAKLRKFMSSTPFSL